MEDVIVQYTVYLTDGKTFTLNVCDNEDPWEVADRCLLDNEVIERIERF